MREKSVRIVSIDARYRKEAYPFIPIYSNAIGTYITGQHIDPNKPETKGNLTKAEMENPQTLTAEKKAKFPYLILPEVRVPLTHLRSFNLSVDETGAYINPKDAAEYDFYMLQTDKVAKNKDSVLEGTHYFYVENLEAEAEVRIGSRKLRFEAETLVRSKGSLAKYKEIALLLNYKLADFRVNINSSERILEDKILDACEKYPSDVVRCFSEEAERDLFILRAEHVGIITRKGESFFDGSQYLGDSLDAVKKFLLTESGSRYERRYQSQLAARENEPKSVSTEKSNAERFETLVDKCSRYILTEFWDDALNFYQEAFTINPENPILAKLKTQIDMGMNNTPKNDEKPKSIEPPKIDNPVPLTKEELEANYASKDRRSLMATAMRLELDKEAMTALNEDELRVAIINKKLGI